MKQIFLNRALRILLMTNAMILVAGAMLGPIYALFVERIGGDLLDASLAGGLFALAAGFTALFSGKFSDKIQESELIIVLGYVIMGIGFILYTIVDSVVFLFCVQIFIGLGEAIYAPAFDSTYSKHLDGYKSGSEWGAWESTRYFTTAIGAVAGGFIVTYFGFQTLFIIMATLCVGSGFFIYLLPRTEL